MSKIAYDVDDMRVADIYVSAAGEVVWKTYEGALFYVSPASGNSWVIDNVWGCSWPVTRAVKNRRD